MNNHVILKASLLVSLAPVNIAVAENNPSDGLWLYQACKSPTYGQQVSRQREKAQVTVLYDISSSGRVINIRVKNSEPAGLLDRYAKKAIRQWRYFAYIKDGVEAPRSDVELTFHYGMEPESFEGATCFQTPLPDPVTTAGDPQEPMNQLKICRSLLMAPKAARDHLSGKVTLQYDISAKGMVSNVRETGIDASELFAETAKKSLRKWRYRPFLSKGTPIPRHNLEIKMFFGERDAETPEHECTYASWDAKNAHKVKVKRKKEWPK